MSETQCPFKVGDRIRQKQSLWPPAVVTEITERGFKYEYDHPMLISPRIGTTDGGECYATGFHFWEKVDDATPSDDYAAGSGDTPEWAKAEHESDDCAGCADAEARAREVANKIADELLDETKPFPFKREDWIARVAPHITAALQSRSDYSAGVSTTPLLKKIVEICDSGSAQEFGDAEERLRAVRGLIIGEAV